MCQHPSAPELGQLLLSKYVSRSRNAIYMEKFNMNVNNGNTKHMYENMFRLAKTLSTRDALVNG